MTHPDASSVLEVLQYAYPIALLFLFLVAFTLRSIKSSSPSNDNDSEQLVFGPGGKPLPKTKKPKRHGSLDGGAEISRSQKSVFEWLSAAACLTWIANAANVIIHAIYSREEGWWCGQSTVVSILW
jgi:hypothetical protein